MRPNRKEYIVESKPQPCSSKPCFADCKEMCQEVLMWSNQDYVGRNSNLVIENGSCGKSMHDIGGDYLDTIAFNSGAENVQVGQSTSNSSWEKIKRLRLSEKMTRLVYSYYVEGRRIRDIAIAEGVTSQAIDVRHNQAKNSIRGKLLVEDIWKRSLKKNPCYDSVEHYDSMVLFFMYHLPRRVIAKLVGVNSSHGTRKISNGINAITRANRACKRHGGDDGLS